MRNRRTEDFIWRRHPFWMVDRAEPERVYPGVDFLLVHWTGGYHGFIQDEHAGTRTAWRSTSGGDIVNKPRRVLVLGAGAIGASIGALLHETGTECVLIARNEHGAAIRANGVELRFPGLERRVLVPTVASLEEAQPSTDDLVLLTTMGQHTADALAGLSPQVAVASFQNGTGPIEYIAARGHTTIAAAVYLPAERRAPGVIALPGVPNIGTIVLGNWPNGASDWASWLVVRLEAAGMRAQLDANVAPWIRAKLLINLGGIVIALCNEPADEVIQLAREEARDVWRAAGQPFEDVAAFLRRVGRFDIAPVDGRMRVGGSTRSALERGDGLETAFLLGSAVAQGRRVGVPTPIHESLILLAEEVARQRWRPGCLSASELRRRLNLVGSDR